MTEEVGRACAELSFAYADAVRAVAEWQHADRDELISRLAPALRRLGRLESQSEVLRGMMRTTTRDVFALGRENVT